MATTYVGFYRASSPEFIYETWRKTGATPPEFQKKIFEFPGSLPATCKLVGSWGVSGGENPGVMVVEAEGFADLQYINQYYNGWLQFDWHPTLTGGVARN
ncbi:MAG: DUF3303 family protein [Dehalococcoidia bacterium]